MAWGNDMTGKKSEVIEQLEMRCEAGQRVLDRGEVLDAGYITNLILPALDAAMEHVYPEIEERHRIPSETDEATMQVTHYTSLAAATFMLRALATGKKPSLRLYDSSHCNDPDEGNYLVRELSSDAGHRWVAKGSATGHAYITSFVNHEGQGDMSDDLVFWRTYGKDGSGCSLTVNAPQQLLRKVLYGSACVEATRGTLAPLFKAVTPFALANEDFANQISGTIWRRLEGVRYLYKDEAYHHEREIRVAIPAQSQHVEPDSVRFEPYDVDGSPLRVRHYLEIGSLALKNLLTSGSRILLGPSVKDKYSVRLYLENLKHQALAKDPRLYDFRIDESKIHYQGL